MMTAFKAMVSVCVLAGLLVGTANAVNIETVTVGNPGNAGKLSGAGAGGWGPDRICGSVGYTYNIGKYEVTAAQYTEFLNKVAASDTYGLYNALMDTAVSENGCNIKRSGTSGSYSYSVASDWANRPVNFVSWCDSARFANWMHNGQPTGVQNASTTEDGSYVLNGVTGNEGLMLVTRKENATWVIPSEDEWYKAAYYKGGSTNAGYWDYPTSSNNVPSYILGNPTDPGNNATYNDVTIGSPYFRTEVGAHENSDSPYGTFDQGGNVWEWNESVFNNGGRGLLGSSYASYVGPLSASNREDSFPMSEYANAGFRVAYVPEPATIVMLALASVGIIRRRKA